MNPASRRLLEAVLARTPLQRWPVRIRHGFLRGARWTLWPHSAYWRGHYEPDVQAALERHAPPPGAAAWDLGAHFGFYTLWLARAVGSTGQVCAFEPDAASFARLRGHVASNRLEHVRLYPCAVSDAPGERLLVQTEGAGATTSHLPYLGEAPPSANAASVHTVALDALLASDRLAPPAFLKIDIEGHAGSALHGARALLARHRPTILISLHSPDEVEGVRAALAPLGYAPRALDDSTLGWSDTLFRTVMVVPPA
ncbi:MAG TPA: FkbM family methyltransferase [Opitutus sp.]|nr:FkbM family methyltransferase [Opitutus sp.]